MTVERIIKLTFLGLFWLWIAMPTAELMRAEAASGMSLGGPMNAAKMVLSLYLSAFIVGVLGKPLPFVLCSLLSALLVLLVFRTDEESDPLQRYVKTLSATTVLACFVYFAILAPPRTNSRNLAFLCIFALLPSVQTCVARAKRTEDSGRDPAVRPSETVTESLTAASHPRDLG